MLGRCKIISTSRCEVLCSQYFTPRYGMWAHWLFWIKSTWEPASVRRAFCPSFVLLKADESPIWNVPIVQQKGRQLLYHQRQKNLAWEGNPTSGLLYTLIWKNISTRMFIAALFAIAKVWKKPKCPSVDEWVKQLWNIYTMEYYSAIKKKKILPIAIVWMNLENIILSEISQSEKDKCHMISLMWI